MHSIMSQLSELTSAGAPVPAFPAARLPAGLARFAPVLKIDATVEPSEPTYQSRLLQWCDEIAALHARLVNGR